MKHKTDTFEYKGYHFTPVKRLPQKDLQLKKLASHQSSDKELNLSTYAGTYTHKSFYEACGEMWYDIFKCKENGKHYVPCANELFEYIEDTHAYFLQLEKERLDKMKRVEICNNLQKAYEIMSNTFTDLQEQNSNGRQFDFCISAELSENTHKCFTIAQKIEDVVYQHR